MSNTRIGIESLNLFIVSTIVIILGFLSYTAFYSLIGDKDTHTIVPAVIFLAIFVALVIVWIIVLKALRKEVLEQKLPQYLWILLAIAILILAFAIIVIPLSYFVVTERTLATPNTCIATTGFRCSGRPIVTPNNIIFNLVNDLGYTVTLSNVNTTLSNILINSSCKGIYLCPRDDTKCTGNEYVLKDGDLTTIRLYGCDFTGLNVVRGQISIDYINLHNGLSETMTVSMTAKIKQ